MGDYVYFHLILWKKTFEDEEKVEDEQKTNLIRNWCDVDGPQFFIRTGFTDCHQLSQWSHWSAVIHHGAHAPVLTRGAHLYHSTGDW